MFVGFVVDNKELEYVYRNKVIKFILFKVKLLKLDFYFFIGNIGGILESL